VGKPNLEGGRLDVTSIVILQLFLKERAREDTLWINMVRDRDK
jgi:hypothetical protein